MKRLTFKGAHGDTLAARLELPQGEPKAYALFAHCFTCSKNLNAAVNISRALAEAGIAVLRFDFTGLGESEGDFADTNFSSNVDDLVAAAEFLEEHYDAPQLLVGHSLGGAAVLQAAHRVPSAKTVATLGAPSEPEHVTKLLESSREEIEREGVAEVSLAGRGFTIKKQFLDDLRTSHMRRVIHKLGKALLVLHSPIDNTVGVQNAADIFITTKHPKSFVSLDNADHLLTRDRDSCYAGAVIATWAAKYLDTRPEKRAQPTWADDIGRKRTVARTEETFRTEVLTHGEMLLADEPESMGGTDTGPTPYDYLAAALSSCTSITLRMYADRKEWPLEAVEVEVKHKKVKSENGNGKPTRHDHFDRELKLYGDLDETQRERLLEIAERCPVHRTLESQEVEVATRLVGS